MNAVSEKVDVAKLHVSGDDGQEGALCKGYATAQSLDRHHGDAFRQMLQRFRQPQGRIFAPPPLVDPENPPLPELLLSDPIETKSGWSVTISRGYESVATKQYFNQSVVGEIIALVFNGAMIVNSPEVKGTLSVEQPRQRFVFRLHSSENDPYLKDVQITKNPSTGRITVKGKVKAGVTHNLPIPDGALVTFFDPNAYYILQPISRNPLILVSAQDADCIKFSRTSEGLPKMDELIRRAIHRMGSPPKTPEGESVYAIPRRARSLVRQQAPKQLAAE